MSAAMKYNMRTPEGNEYGPVDQETLVSWADAGRITADCEIRNTMMRNWSKADKVAFLKETLARQKKSPHAGETTSTSISKLFNPAVEKKGMQSLNKPGQFVYAPGTTEMRAGAWAIDTVILGAIAIVLIYLTQGALESNPAGRDVIYILFTVGLLGSILCYYTLSIGLTAQTAGQWFLGLMVVRAQGEPVLLGRAFVFSVGFLLFSWSTLLLTFCLPSKRAIQDFFSGTRVVKITTK